MNLTAQQLSGEHIGKTVTIEDRYARESVTAPLLEAVYADPNTPITIQEEQ